VLARQLSAGSSPAGYREIVTRCDVPPWDVIRPLSIGSDIVSGASRRYHPLWCSTGAGGLAKEGIMPKNNPMLTDTSLTNHHYYVRRIRRRHPVADVPDDGDAR
jgi:hypothetical protein